ncbi:MAG: AraC family transcriptional regulator, partial [Spirochaetia bacterium]|nr:AraC family transcriptional regulator [Spirochaetia bacterium]
IFLRVQDFVCKHYMHDISLETVAQELQMNPSYLSRVLTKDSGIGFSSYLTNLRIEKAIELMTGSSLKLYEIAEAVGFNSSETFSRAFKRVKQVSPQSYLKKVK